MLAPTAVVVGRSEVPVGVRRTGLRSAACSFSLAEGPWFGAMTLLLLAQLTSHQGRPGSHLPHTVAFPYKCAKASSIHVRTLRAMHVSTSIREPSERRETSQGRLTAESTFPRRDRARAVIHSLVSDCRQWTVPRLVHHDIRTRGGSHLHDGRRCQR